MTLNKVYNSLEYHSHLASLYVRTLTCKGTMTAGRTNMRMGENHSLVKSLEIILNVSGMVGRNILWWRNCYDASMFWVASPIFYSWSSCESYSPMSMFAHGGVPVEVSLQGCWWKWGVIRTSQGRAQQHHWLQQIRFPVVHLENEPHGSRNICCWNLMQMWVQ